MAICFMMLIVFLEKHPLAGESVDKSLTKIDPKKLAPKATESKEWA